MLPTPARGRGRLSKPLNKAAGWGGAITENLQCHRRSSPPSPVTLGHGRSLLGFLVVFVSNWFFLALSEQHGHRS